MEKNIELNFEVVFLKTIKHALNRFLNGAIQLSLLIIDKDMLEYFIASMIQLN